MWWRGEVHTVCWWGNLKEGVNLEDLGVDGRIILKLLFQKCGFGGGGMDWLDQVLAFFKCGNKPQGYVKCKGCLDYLRTY
jgi:hypothetical protein